MLAYDILARPAISQIAKVGTNRKNTLDVDKYFYDVIARAAVKYFIPEDFKFLYRGISRSIWDVATEK